MNKNAYSAGYYDALYGRAYRHSAQPGSVNRSHLKDYEKGWQNGRRVDKDKLLFLGFRF